MDKIDQLMARMHRNEAYDAYLPQDNRCKRLPFGRGYVRLDVTDDFEMDVHEMFRAIDGVAPIAAFLLLYNIIRYSGGLGRKHDVLAHSLQVSNFAYNIAKAQGANDVALAEVRFYGLVHDLHECVIGDLVSPLKHAYPALAQLDAVAEAAMQDAMRIEKAHPITRQIIKQADRDSFKAEYREYFPGSWPSAKPEHLTDLIDQCRFIWNDYRLKCDAGKRIIPFTGVKHV